VALITSFYSDPAGSERFRGYARRLEADLKAIGAAYEIGEVTHCGSWLRTCRAKPRYLESVLERVARPIVWVDADSRVYKPLPELGPATYDVAAPASTLSPIGRVRFHVEAALIYLNHTPGAREFLSRWRTKCESLDWPVGDHCHFLCTWEELEASGGVKLLKLPPGVCARSNGGGNFADLVTSEFPGKQAEVDLAVRFHREAGTR
jgi:hypothetical protein